MPVVRYIARHDDLGEFTHGKLDVSSDEFDKVRNEASLGVKSNSDTFTVLYRGLLLQYEGLALPDMRQETSVCTESSFLCHHRPGVRDARMHPPFHSLR